jgi:hypothetical protein
MEISTLSSLKKIYQASTDTLDAANKREFIFSDDSLMQFWDR